MKEMWSCGDIFWEQFHGSIQKDWLTYVKNSRYLKSYLTGKAGAKVNGISDMEENYQAAVDILKEPFEQAKIIVRNHMTHLLNFKSATSLNAPQLRLFYDSVAVHVRSLEGLDYHPYIVPGTATVRN